MTKKKPIERKKDFRLTIIFCVVFLVLVFFLMCFTIKCVNTDFKRRVKLSCADYFIEDAINSVDLKQLCSTENCIEYFDNKINTDFKLAMECLK